jgi:hypothetical protein
MEMKGKGVGWAAHLLGIDKKYLMTLLSLLEAPHEVKRLVEEKKLDPSTAGEIAYGLKDKHGVAVKVARKVAKAERNKRELARRLVKEVKLKEKEVKLPKEEYSVIYADPPWEYDFSVDELRSIPAHKAGVQL